MTQASLPPEQRTNQIGRLDLEGELRALHRGGGLHHGWIIAGPSQAGKATLAYRIARGVLDPDALANDNTFAVDEAASVHRLIASGSHPDLFVAAREVNEKTDRMQTDISVETIRKMIAFLNKTPGLSKARVAIVDTADHLNRSAANALLKVLEEPPSNVLLMLLSSSPARLLPTIRSRCRRLVLRPVSEDEIADFVVAETDAGIGDARLIAARAGGRPGFALSLSEAGGAEALRLAGAFVEAANGAGDIRKIAASFSAKTEPAQWAAFVSSILDDIAKAARAAARNQPIVEAGFRDASPGALAQAHAELSRFAARAEALNLERSHIVQAMGQDLQNILKTGRA